MSNMMKMMQKAASMKKEMKQMQKELEKQTVEYECRGGKVKVVASGDMALQSIKIDPRSVNPEKMDALEDLIVTGVNGALKAAKKKAASQMSKNAGGLGGLADMLG